MSAIAIAALCSSLLGEAGRAETVSERYFRSAEAYLDGKTPAPQPVRIQGKTRPGLPATARSSAVPAEYRMERDWQKGEECGPVALFFLLRSQKIKVTIDEVLRSMLVTDRGTSMGQLREAAARFGLETDVVKFTPEEFQDLPVPFVVHWKGPGDGAAGRDHFDVALRADADAGGLIVDTTNCVVTSLGSMRAIGSRASGYALVVRERPMAAGMYWVFGGLAAVNLGLFACRSLQQRRSPVRAVPAGAAGVGA